MFHLFEVGGAQLGKHDVIYLSTPIKIEMNENENMVKVSCLLMLKHCQSELIKSHCEEIVF